MFSYIPSKLILSCAQLIVSDGKVRFSLVQRPFCLNPELNHWFGSGDFLEPELNPQFRLERVQFRFRERPNPEPNPECQGLAGPWYARREREAVKAKV